MNEVNYKIAKSGQSAKWKIVHFNMLKPYVEEPPDVTQRRPTPMRSDGYFDEVDEKDELDGFDREVDNRGYMTQYPNIRRVARPDRYRRGERPRWMMDEDDWLGDLFRDDDLAEAQRRGQPHGERTRGRPPDVEMERRERRRDVEPLPDRERRCSTVSGPEPAMSAGTETPEGQAVEPGGDVDISSGAEPQSTPAATDSGQALDNQTSSRPKRNVAPP